MRLHCTCAIFDSRGKRLQQIYGGLGIGVDDDHSVRPRVRAAGVECERECVALTATIIVSALQYRRTGGAGDVRRRIAAVIGDDQDPKPILRPIQFPQIRHGAGYYAGLVVSRHDDIEAQLSTQRGGGDGSPDNSVARNK